MFPLSGTAVTIAASITLSAAYVWPNPMLDELESLHYDQRGYKNYGSSIALGVDPCSKFLFGRTPGRSNAADWIRTAYHDMASHSIEDGTGGLDGSIRFSQEQARPENPGDGFKNTIGFFEGVFNRDASVADIIALGLVTAVEQCGGPKIPYRAGRIDATQPNAPGVPEPQQDLNLHTASFARQGFTPTEMISLVACGHSFGGVQHSAFPEIVAAGPNPDLDVQATFDTTPVLFDNRIAKEYVEGTTSNPLTVGHNATTRSDLRIFSSDGNATMRSFADSPDLFASTCSRLFEKMIDTVPSDVVLSEPIEPLPVKPVDVSLTYMGDGTFALQGVVRFWNMRENNNRKVTLHWADRSGALCANCSVPIRHTPDQVSSARSGTDHTALWYHLSAAEGAVTRINGNSGISRFWFEIDEGAGGGAKVEDQGGVGFVLQDTVMLLNGTCRDTRDNFRVKIGVAIRKNAQASRVYVEVDKKDSFETPIVEVVDVPAPSAPPNGDYELRTVKVQSERRINVAADVGGKWLRTAYFDAFRLPDCA